MPRAWPIAALVVVLCFLASCPAQLRAQSAVAADPSSATASQASDGDDDADELTYHWSNIRYGNDERRQMGYILIVLGALGSAASLRGGRRRRRAGRLDTGARA